MYKHGLAFRHGEIPFALITAKNVSQVWPRIAAAGWSNMAVAFAYRRIPREERTTSKLELFGFREGSLRFAPD